MEPISSLRRAPLQIEASPDDSGLDCIDIVLCFFSPVHAFTVYQQMFFECGQFRSIGDHVTLKIAVGNVFHGGIAVEIAQNPLNFFLRGLGPYAFSPMEDRRRSWRIQADAPRIGSAEKPNTKRSILD